MVLGQNRVWTRQSGSAFSERRSHRRHLTLMRHRHAAVNILHAPGSDLQCVCHASEISLKFSRYTTANGGAAVPDGGGAGIDGSTDENQFMIEDRRRWFRDDGNPKGCLTNHFFTGGGWSGWEAFSVL